MTIKTVAVIGASGNLGGPVVQALLKAGFLVTAITRESSTSTFPPSVSVRKADLSSLSSLTAALANQDAAICTIGTTSIESQSIIIDAAIAAGVKRFMPSEFGSDVRPGKLSGPLATILGPKTASHMYLVQETEKNPGFTYTALATSLFFEFGFDMGVFGIDLKGKKAQVFDSGDEPMSTSSYAFIADAVVAVLQHEAETENRYLMVAEFTVSQNDLLRIVEGEAGEKFEVERVRTEELDVLAAKKLEEGDYAGSFMDALHSLSFKDGHGHAVPESESANGLLEITGADLREKVREVVKSRGL